MNLLRERARLLPDGGCCRFDGGDSSSSTTNKTENVDMRVVGGDQSANLSVRGDSNTVTLTDHGAVAGGLAVATHAIDAVKADAVQLQQTTQTLYQGALSTASSAVSQLANAWEASKSPDKNILIIGGAIVVGLAAVLLRAKGS